MNITPGSALSPSSVGKTLLLLHGDQSPLVDETKKPSTYNTCTYSTAQYLTAPGSIKSTNQQYIEFKSPDFCFGTGSYTVEMFVPAAKRVWGYYVYPLLEADRFVGRIEAKADRKQDRLTVQNLWWEPGVRVTAQRQAKLESELARLARLADVSEIVWQVPAR